MMPRELVASWQDAMDAHRTRDFIRCGRATRELILGYSDAHHRIPAQHIGQLLHWATVPAQPMPIGPGEQLPQAVVDSIADTLLSETEALPWPGGVHETGAER